MNTYYIEVDNRKMCCFCGKEVFGKRKDENDSIKYQCNCDKALKQIEANDLICLIEVFLSKNYTIDWNKVEEYKDLFKQKTRLLKE